MLNFVYKNSGIFNEDMYVLSFKQVDVSVLTRPIEMRKSHFLLSRKCGDDVPIHFLGAVCYTLSHQINKRCYLTLY